MVPRMLFDNKVVCGHTDVSFGNLRPNDESRVGMILYIAHGLGAERIFAPSLNFTNMVVGFRHPDVCETYQGFYRTRTKYDGGFTTYKDVAIAIFNADCHVGVIYKPENGVLGVLHLGLNCFFREDGSPSILENAIRVLGGNVSELMFWFGAGIGHCCYGHDLNIPENEAKAKKIKQKFGEDVIEGEVQHGPRKGQTAYKIPLMILRHAEQLGFRHIDLNFKCTSCAGLSVPDEPGYGEYFSNVRDAKHKGERNCFIARLRDR